ncbi:unnamed protein product [Symbiodinium microadriaticum]|nr:unnamed protein product [Symbiodinium microadriaticum]
MLEFYFRNGPLRRKYDGLKYALKRVENIVFEISMTPSPEGGWTYPSLSSTEGLSPQDVEPVTKKSRTDCSILKVDFFDQHHFLSASDLDGVRERLEAMDAQREVVIKKSRDTQKLSKQAIFSMQGDRLDEALQKLNKARDVVVELLPVVAQHPSLRVGSFSNSLEEWAEGRMFLAWLADARVIGMSELGSDMLGIDLTAHEYVGALSDFTGEMGRLAVKRASARHLEGVLEVREVIAAIVRAMSVLSLGEKFAQKFMAMTTNLQKVEDLIYELCMMQKSGSSRPKLRSDETATEEGK